MNESTLSRRDAQVIWHPYSQHGLNRQILPVSSARGAYLKLEDGREILDAISSWWVNVHGHSHPGISKAIEKQASKLEHVIFAGFTHEPAVALAETLTNYPSLQSRGLTKVFYSDNGSTAVEVALKMAYQYHLNRGVQTRQKFIALSNSYHGDTLGAMAVGEPNGFHSQFRPLLPQVDFVDVGDLSQLEALLEKNPESYAAFIFEPLVQGAAGMKSVPASYLEAAVELCQRKGVLILCDEVFTGFHRTGTCFAVEQMRFKPDLLCLSKGITGGFLPLAVTLTSEEIYSGFLSKEIRTAFLHGHSYTANPIACAAALESWALLRSPECQSRIEAICQITQDRIKRLSSHPKVKDARCIGTIGAVEWNENLNYFSSNTGALLSMALEKNILLRPLGNVLYAVPPYCCTDEEIHRIYDVMEQILESQATC